MGPYRPRVSWLYNIRPPADQRSAGLWGWRFSLLAGRSILWRYPSVFIPGLSDMYVWIDDDPGMGPSHPQMTVTLCTIPGQ